MPLYKKRCSVTKEVTAVRAHCNPFSDVAFRCPISPQHMDWSHMFPDIKDPVPSFVDIGCGFGSLLLELGRHWPDKVGVGMEIREIVVKMVHTKIMHQRKQNDSKNVAVVATNAMKFITHFFEKQSLSVMFFCFPDPHFKGKNARKRIITTSLLDHYAYLLQDDGKIYNITDVKTLYEWTVDQFAKHSLFERLTEDELKDDKLVTLISNTDEGQRVTRMKGSKYICVYRRKSNPPL